MIEWAWGVAEKYECADPPSAGLVKNWVRVIFGGDGDWFCRCWRDLALAGHLDKGTGYLYKALQGMADRNELQADPPVLPAFAAQLEAVDRGESEGDPPELQLLAPPSAASTPPSKMFVGRPNYTGEEVWDGREFVPRKEFVERFPDVEIPLSPCELEEQAAASRPPAPPPPPAPWQKKVQP